MKALAEVLVEVMHFIMNANIGGFKSYQPNANFKIIRVTMLKRV